MQLNDFLAILGDSTLNRRDRVRVDFYHFNFGGQIWRLGGHFQEVEIVKKEKIIEIVKEVPVPVEKVVDVYYDVIVDVPIERTIEKERIVEVEIEKPVEKIVEIPIE